MAIKNTQPQCQNAEPEFIRRKLVASFCKRAAEKRWTLAERREFARMADAWERTLPEKPS